MEDHLDQEMWRRLREEARQAATTGQEEAERCTRAALGAADLELLAHLEQRLGQLNGSWAVHEKPLLSRVPLLGPLFTWVGAHLVRFLLQNQVGLNAESARLFQQLYQAQRLWTREQLERSDDLFSRLDERLLALEARLKDIEAQVSRGREQR